MTSRLLEAMAETDDAEERRRIQDEVVLVNLEVAEALAARYRNRGIPDDDLTQVAYLGLVKAVQGFDESVGKDFLSYAVPTVRGEIKKHFRDHGWTVRPPRRIQDLQSRIPTAQAELTQTLGRSPRPSELARHLKECLADVTEALSVDGCFTPSSLDVPVGVDRSTTLGDLLGEDDDGLRCAEARVTLGPAVAELSERDRTILMLRFFKGRTQQEIADEIGVTQMQVSRLLARILTDLRGKLA